MCIEFSHTHIIATVGTRYTLNNRGYPQRLLLLLSGHLLRLLHFPLFLGLRLFEDFVSVFGFVFGWAVFLLFIVLF